ncbi:hypothetical protein LentiSH36_00832 [Lentibacter algarum]|uniref:Uncharacterized protein n=1 Tax=Lentibacter algarum TaxID=576131 RepID=A0A1H3I4T4_9RHOB|nr:hypothetical protein LentiSH36_00832 [Lentibacter algarum]SDY22690.1 hypothetical protein SAMN05444486_101864 [Lentibacter algarum]
MRTFSGSTLHHTLAQATAPTGASDLGPTHIKKSGDQFSLL